MTPPPKAPAFSRENFPDTPEQLLQALNQFCSDVSSVLDRGLSRQENLAAGEKTDGTFTTSSTVANTWPVRVKVDFLCRHVSVSRLSKRNEGALSNAWSFSWKNNSKGEVELTFQGLEASTQYDFSLLYE